MSTINQNMNLNLSVNTAGTGLHSSSDGYSSFTISMSEQQKNIYWYLIWQAEKPKFEEYKDNLETLQAMLDSGGANHELALEYVKNKSEVIYALLTSYGNEEEIYSNYFTKTFKKLI